MRGVSCKETRCENRRVKKESEHEIHPAAPEARIFVARIWRHHERRKPALADFDFRAAAKTARADSLGAIMRDSLFLKN
jgi:hypothetical protein